MSIVKLLKSKDAISVISLAGMALVLTACIGVSPRPEPQSTKLPSITAQTGLIETVTTITGNIPTPTVVPTTYFAPAASLSPTPDNRLKITDFGIARALSTIDPQEKSDVVWGSPQYLSPEQATGAAPTPASDVYSLGVVIYEMFTGRLPFDTDDMEQLASMRLTSDPIPPRLINPEISEGLEKIILKVLSKEPSQRYRTADQLGRVLLTFGQQTDSYFLVPPPIPQPEVTTTSNFEVTPPSISLVGEDEPPSTSNPVDWKTIGLELTCLLAAGGLIPFWLYVWFSIRPLLH